MHPYAVDVDERRAVLLKLLVPTVLMAVGTQWVWAWLIDVVFETPPVWLLALIGPSGAAGLLAFVVVRIEDKWWSKGVVRWCLGISTPDLRGTWKVEGVTSYDDGNKNWSATTTIDQTWTKVLIYQDALFSYSESTSASIKVGSSPTHPTLNYEYRNTPKPEAFSTMHIHRGFVNLRLSVVAEHFVLTGEYYTHPKERANWGSMVLTHQ
ncbi:MAG TPA: hypothetical protein VGT61_10520 [Thermomicrobiales bacterium]|jgi:hypothetical protein|nr:hypothetical protein [Thermomicrobiales bacterium]